jgi:hypothetical protein
MSQSRTVGTRRSIYELVDQRENGAPGALDTLMKAWSGILLTDTLDGDDGAIPDGDVGGERPNDQRGAGGVGNGLRCVDGHREWPPPASA